MKREFTKTFGLAMILLLASCGGGGNGTTTPPPQDGGTGPAFSVVLTAEPEQGPSPLTVAFSAYAFGGTAPYQFEWDFNGDRITDSTETNPFFTFASSTSVLLRVTDSNNRVVEARRSITITASEPTDLTPPLNVTFTSSVTAGTAPLQVTFEALVTGGSPPYIYAWDLDGDGEMDSFSQKVVWTYTSPGKPTPVEGLPTQFYYFPSLTVTDNRGIQRSTIDDTNGDGQPDWRVIINVMPRGILSPSIRANPIVGQAPLPVDFSAGASGGEPPYRFKWDFGDGTTTDWSFTSFMEHIYESTGEFHARVTVRDNQNVEEVSGAAVITVLPEPSFKVTITADETAGSVPFKVELNALVEGGRQPISYRWEVFTDLTPSLQEPTIVALPSVPQPFLDSDAIVVPSLSNDTAPTMVFGTYVGQQMLMDTDGNGGNGAPYVVRLVVKDANGVEAVSNLIRITPLAPEPDTLYQAVRAPKVGDTIYSQGWSPTFTARANAATVAHDSGVVFLIGGEILSQTGEFLSVVPQTDSAWALNLSGEDIGDPDNGLGYANGGWTQMNVLDLFPYPEWPDGTQTVPNPDPYDPPYSADPIMARAFIKCEPFWQYGRGSAAAAFVHEPVDTNPPVGYGGEGGIPDNMRGVPVIYVFGGRDSRGDILDTVQKYYPVGFGTEALPIDTDVDGGDPDAQVTNNQADVWSDRFQFMDRDLWPQMGDQVNPPIVPDRPPINRRGGGGAGGAVLLNLLPRPLYGASAVTVESYGLLNPVFPESHFSYVFLFGGIEYNTDTGEEHVVATMRWFNTRQAPPDRQEGQDPRPGDYSVVVDMPIERAYHKAIVIPPDLVSNRPWQVVVFGGYDRNGNYIAQVDKFTFNSVKNPTTGSWQTIGVLPEATVAPGAGWEFESPGRGFVYRQFVGKNVDGYTGSVIEITDSGSMSYAPETLLPRSWASFGQIGYDPDYYVISGTTEQGMTTVIERYRP